MTRGRSYTTCQRPHQRSLCMILVLTIMIVGHLISTSDTFDHSLITSKFSSVMSKSSSSSSPSINSTSTSTGTGTGNGITEKPEYKDLDIQQGEDNYTWTEPCKFRTNHPQPVILMSLGRSGSSITWDTMSALTGERNTAHEVTGGNPQSSKTFFSNLQNDAVFQQYTNWTLQRLCHVQREGGRREDITDQSGIAGFQWKPFSSSWNHPYAIKGLQAVANSTDPIVKIVYLTRNPLDRKVSNLRHKNSKLNSNQQDVAISPHCAVGDTKCQERHSQFSSNINFPTGSKLIEWLRNAERQDRRIHERLDEFHIPFVEVPYEKLYGIGKDTDTDKAEEWMKLFRYLRVGPQEGLTMEKVKGAFSMASTHKKSRNDTIENFEAVKETLVGTDYEYLLAD